MRGGRAVSHPGVGNVGGPSNRWVTAAQRVFNSALRGESGRANRVTLWPGRRIPNTNQSGRWEEPGVVVVLPTWDYGTSVQKKKGKVTRERRKLMVVTHGRKEGAVYFAINRIAETPWTQTAPDKLLVGFLWMDLKVGCMLWKCCSDPDDMQRSAWEINAGVFTTIPAGPNLFTRDLTLCRTLFQHHQQFVCEPRGFYFLFPQLYNSSAAVGQNSLSGSPINSLCFQTCCQKISTLASRGSSFCLIF